MRGTSNFIVGLLAAGICTFMVWLSLGAGTITLIYNLSFLVVMIIIIILALALGFRRMNQTAAGLDRASRKLIGVYKNKAEMSEITRPGAQIFEVEYLDKKYQEYLGYLRKTNSPCDIGDYIGEYEINNYTHRRLVEMVPDVLTSLGILGTFMGLVWGLKGFNPVSYEAMASSITSLIDGIKVAFVSSIFGITLSLAYSYWLRGELTKVSESLDNFLDKYYLCAVSPTDATAMNHVLANQKEQTRVMEGLSKAVSTELAVSMADHLDPVMTQMNHTLDHFVRTVTLNQEELMENIAQNVAASLKREVGSEFVELRTLLRETNRVQKDYLNYITQAQQKFEKNLETGNEAMAATIRESQLQQENTMKQLEAQQEHLREFVDYMSKAMEAMSGLQEQNAKITDSITETMMGHIEAIDKLTRESSVSAANANDAMSQAIEAARNAQIPPIRYEISDLDELTERLDRVIELMEKNAKQTRSGRRGLFS